MKKYLNKLFIFLLALVLVVPFGVFAADDDAEDEESDLEIIKEPVKVYEFYGSTCGYCASLNEWFNSIEEEYGDYFDLVKLEVWENADNATLMEKVADKLDTTVSGVPFVVIGENYSTGFDESVTPDTILGYIMSEYEKDEADRIDVVGAAGDATEEEEDSKSGDIILGFVVVILIVGTIVVVIKARSED